jgi:hypothetical protein
MVRFRFHRGGLAESLATAIEVADKAHLADRLNAAWDFGPRLTAGDISCEYYADDPRSWGPTWIVTCKDGVMGFSDGPLQ